MPYKSVKQERWAHTEIGLKALGGKNKVSEWDQASKGMDLPVKVNDTPNPSRHGYAMNGKHFDVGSARD